MFYTISVLLNQLFKILNQIDERCNLSIQRMEQHHPLYLKDALEGIGQEIFHIFSVREPLLAVVGDNLSGFLYLLRLQSFFRFDDTISSNNHAHQVDPRITRLAGRARFGSDRVVPRRQNDRATCVDPLDMTKLSIYRWRVIQLYSFAGIGGDIGKRTFFIYHKNGTISNIALTLI